MKKCPQCGREYDLSMSFCLDDGAELLYGPAVSEPGVAAAGFRADDEPQTAVFSEPPASAGGQFDEPQTAILHSTAAPDEAPTRAQIHATEQTAVLPGGAEAEHQGSFGSLSEKPGFSARRAKRLIAAAVGMVVLVGGFFGYRYLNSSSKQIESIAVMPFINNTSDADAEYLSDGMTESLISSLTKLPDLDVKPRSTVFRYKGKDWDARRAGKELNVQAVLSGRVVQRGSDISLFVELIDISQDKAIWSETYNRKQTDLVSLQSEIARDVSSNIKTKLSGQDVAKVTKTYTTNPEAYQLYLKGNFHLAKFSEDGYQKGIEYYNQAIALDPNYALAYHGIATAYDFSGGFYLAPNESYPKAKAAALRALELDATLAETHYLLGKIVYWYDWDWSVAERHWKRASELDPAYPAMYPLYLSATAREDEAVNVQESLLRRFPLDLSAHADLGGLLLFAGKYDEAIEKSRMALELDPNFWWSHHNLGLAYERKKQYPEAIAALEKARLFDSNKLNVAFLGAVYAKAGRTTEALRLLGELKELSQKRYVSSFNIALIYAGLGDKDKAFEWFETAYKQREPYMTLLGVTTVIDNLRDDARYKNLLRRMNLPD